MAKCAIKVSWNFHDDGLIKFGGLYDLIYTLYPIE